MIVIGGSCSTGGSFHIAPRYLRNNAIAGLGVYLSFKDRPARIGFNIQQVVESGPRRPVLRLPTTEYIGITLVCVPTQTLVPATINGAA
jgi:hypothetical protein